MLSLVIPVYKNEGSLPDLLRQLASLANGFPDDLEVVFVVDGSPDQSAAYLRKALPGLGTPAQLIELSRNFGSFAAITAGLHHGRGDYFAVIAADLQEPPELIAEFHRLLASDTADVVLGYRRHREDPWPSRVMAAAFWEFYRRAVVSDMPRGGVDVFGCTRQVRDRLIGLRETNSSLVALLLWVGFRRTSVPYDRAVRRHGRSAWTLGRKFRYALDSIFNFTDLPIKLLLAIGAVATCASAVASLTVLGAWWMGRVPVLGYVPLMLAICAVGGITALGLGIVGQYIWLSLQNTRDRPAFIVRMSERFDATAQGPSEARASDRNSS